MKPYPEYKASGIDWLGEIPCHWEPSKLKYLVSCNDDVLPESTDSSKQINYVEISDVSQKDGIFNISKITFEDAPSRARRITKLNDVIISTVRTYLKAIASINNDEIIVSTGFAVLRPSKINSRFLYYSLASDVFLNQVENQSSGVSYPAISSTDLINIQIAVPTEEEQEAIAGYLDEMTGKIDALISEKTAQVEELRDYRSSLITETVTHGLNPDAPLRDSGIDWLGQIPEHWEVSKLAWLADVQTGTTPSTSETKYWDEPTELWFTPGDFQSMELNDSSRKVSKTAYLKNACRLFPPFTVYLVGIGATLGKIAYCKTESSANQQINAIIFNDRIYPIYGAYFLNGISNVIKSSSNAATLPILNQEQTKKLQVTVPPLSEQQEIADFLDEKTSKIDRLIDELTKQLDELAEYKQAIITEAVTGKVDVRDYKPKI